MSSRYSLAKSLILILISLADDVVGGEPVCGNYSLLTGKRAGNYLKFAVFIDDAA